MSITFTVGDYVAQTQKWREAFGIPVYLSHAEMAAMAEGPINEMQNSDPAGYASLLSDAQAWAERENARIEGRPANLTTSIPDAAPRAAPNTEGIKQQLGNIAIGKYLMAHGDFDNSINETIAQGALQSIDWNNGTLILRNTAGQDLTVEIGRISSIDESRTGPGALGAVQQGDLRQVGNDWYRGNEKLDT